jgi:hypothetical protein
VLARHELYAARFYHRLDAPDAVIRRLEILLDRYAGSGYEAEALLLLGQVYAETDRPNEARHVLDQLVEHFPEAEEVEGAREQLSELPPPSAAAEPAPEPAAEPASEPDAEPEADLEAEPEADLDAEPEAGSQ